MKKNRFIYRVLILTAFLLINALLLFGIGEVYSYLNSGADKAGIFHGDLRGDINYHPEIKWDITTNKGLEISPTVVKDIVDDYKLAWFIRNNALYSLEDTGIADLYTANAREELYNLIELNKKTGVSIESTTLSHNLQIDFFSADGKIISFIDKDVTGFSRVTKHDEFVYEANNTASYKVIMLLEDGFWRIRHLVRTSSEETETMIRETIPLIEPIAGINYYPQDSAWDTFGEKFNEATIKKELTLIKDLGLNTIRIFVNYKDFGGADVRGGKLNKLSRLLDLSNAEDINVIITLFDFYGDYSIKEWTATREHAKTIVNSVKEHPALLGWDVKNEPDLDFDNRNSNVVKSWLTQMLRYIKYIDPEHPVTVGWSNPESALNLVNEVDYISFHYYEDVKLLGSAISRIRSNTSKPMVLQEFGLSTNYSFWSPFGNDEKDQAEYYEAFYKIQKRDSIHYLSWTLFDFEIIPKIISGNSPWRKIKQSNFGLVTISGAKKPAFTIIKSNH
ncbi:MAG: cellulase family glycosylhydrolase [Bacteroidia bacterium]|nr:cellulase family glycosylhydrolase [Bacteroidia bacterium]NNF31675.1 cellulase family glycosylhydrolase [Flavobacteriaceae bacterium]NNJ82224.1 cellulase family glycosylhydrolase [Flavobacteriaceae bacterium]NNK55189.1 cellulase family glycosylhydrolase [Flavobacteriaceae bacterium]NNM10184.1 cellulase family glycosylhydrolase [Flavobacteriaceae bacterium]